MAVGWFLVPYVTTINPPGSFPKARRSFAFAHLISQISSDGGRWSHGECLGDHLVAKIRASEQTLSDMNAIPGVVRFPKNLISDSLYDLTNAQKTAIKDKLLELGYPLSEIKERFGTSVDLGSYTLADVIRFVLKRRNTPRFDDVTQTVILDGKVEDCRPIEEIDQGA